MVLSLGLLALDYPAPFVKGTMIHRSLPIRVVLLFFQAFLAVMWYQVHHFFVTLMEFHAQLSV